MYKYSIILIFFLCISSCINVASEIKNWIETDNIEDIHGRYHFLNNDGDGIKIYLPDSFKKYSLASYEQLLDSLINKEEDYDLEIKRLENLRKMKGNFYIFFDEITRSSYTINTIPYMPLYKRDAQQILGMISLNNKNISKDTNLEITKITAKYSSSSNTQIFKAVHKIHNTKKQITNFNSSYIVSSNKKTIYIQLLTGVEVNFNPFLQKMIL